jgi:hypothetical protein
LEVLPEFVSSRLADAECGGDAVVVLGGPPFTAYSNIRSDVAHAFNRAISGHAQGSSAAQVQFEAVAAAYGQELENSDQLVSDFIALFQTIKTASGQRPCYLIMENPYSRADRGLWNRWELACAAPCCGFLLAQ